MSAPLTLDAYVSALGDSGAEGRATARAVLAIAEGAIEIADVIRRGPLAGRLGASKGGNTQGDDQKELDVLANDALMRTLRAAGVAAIASEEIEKPEIVDPAGTVAVAIDPLDGSSNIDTNISIGTIFSVISVAGARGGLDGVFLQPGTAQRAAGYVIYGPHVALVLTVGAGTHFFTLNSDTRTFVRTGAPAAISPNTGEYAINASNYRHWSDAMRAYVDDCVAGQEGPHESDFNTRWIASLVAECHRILVRGGVFLYPRDNRKGYENGRLRLVYEANPIAMLVEQAGGMATDGRNRIMDVVPTAVHQRSPLIFGSAREIERIIRYKADPNASFGRSQLFGRRGLLKT